jgi:hypothetical protein
MIQGERERRQGRRSMALWVVRRRRARLWLAGRAARTAAQAQIDDPGRQAIQQDA